MRFDRWQRSFSLESNDPLELAERILCRPARLEQEWTDGRGRQLRLYVPADDRRILATDEIITRQDGDRWRRVRFVDRPRRG